jgi:GMP synthase-like glutamine amidotransferase
MTARGDADVRSAAAHDGAGARGADRAAARDGDGAGARGADRAAARDGYGARPRALLLQHGDYGPPGLLAEWLDERGIAYDLHRTYVGEPMPDPTGYAFVATLGSDRNPNETDDPAVAAELALLRRAVDDDVPVLGLCFGGQALAVVLGGSVETAPRPEIGWTEIETDDPELVPPGPWLEWHFERFSSPPGATEIARTSVATQAFIHGRHLGVQFHPESTVEIVEQWAESDRDRVGDVAVDATPAQRAAAREAAFALFDGFLERANEAAPVAARRG